jgi:signal transduction histidine kinase/ligand-binding sensor domain-containing protein
MGTMSAMVTGNPGSFRSVPLPTTSPQSLYYPIQAFADADDGTLLVGRAYPDGKSHLDKFSDGHWTSYQVPGLDGSKTEVNVMRRLRDGSLWVGTTGGLYIVRNGQAEHYDVSDGLSGSTVEDIFEDREGDVWLLTDYGLESFRIPKVITFSHASGLSTGSVGPVLAARNGSVYVGLPGGLDEIRGDSIHHLPYANTAFNFLLTEDHTGRLWAGLGTRLGVREGDRFRLIKRTDGTLSGVPKGLVEDASGDLWGVGVLPQLVLLRIHHDVVTEVPLGTKDNDVESVGVSQNGGILVAFRDGSVVTYKDGVETPLAPVGKSPIYAPIQLPDGRLLAMRSGRLAGFTGGQWHDIGLKNGLPYDDMFSFLLDKQRTLWMYMPCGLVSISQEEQDRFWKDTSAKLNYRIFDSSDGVHAAFDEAYPPGAAGMDGRLWFGNDVNLQMIDTRHIVINPLPPPVHIESVVADRKTYIPQPSLHLPHLTRDLEIDYTALSLVVPEKVRFRYRLEDRDKDWQDPRTRRQAFYTDLPPNHYRFQVIASNNDGVWNNVGDSLSFSIPPAFYQTIWFRVTLFTVAACLIWLVFYFRLRAVSAGISARLEERLRERERIAAELHDTLLQDFQTVILRVQVGANRLFKEDPSRKLLEETLDFADKVLADGRDHIRDIRSDGKALGGLSENFATYGGELSKLWPLTFSMAVTGEEFEIHPSVRDEIHLIGRDAIGNAFKHSNGSKVEVTITYSTSEFKMQIIDDGDGIEGNVLQEGRPGHWGLHTMRERARKVGATLSVSSHTLTGTAIELTAPRRSHRSLRRFFGRSKTEEAESDLIH